MSERLDEALVTSLSALGLRRLGEGRSGGVDFVGEDPEGVGVHVRVQDDGSAVVGATLAPPLFMALELRARRPDDPEGVRLETAGLDRIAYLRANDDDFARRVIVPIAGALVQRIDRQPSLRITDDDVTVTLDPPVDPVEVEVALEETTELARWLRAIRLEEHAPWEPRVAASWPTIAATWGGVFDPRPRIDGVFGGDRFTVWLFPAAVPITALVITSSWSGPRVSLHRPDDRFAQSRFERGEVLELGDPELDALVVRGEPEDEVRELLRPHKRAALLDLLGRASAVGLETGRIELHSPGAVTQGAGIEAMIMDARKIAARLAEVDAEPRPRRGPYR
ncbi:MAG: hypothetical protein AB7S26_05025 [Sandaracinaceae bacterium]